MTFKKLLEHMQNPLILLKPMYGEYLYLYLAVLAHALSVALVQEEPRVQRPLYYISKQFNGAESRYPR